MTSQKKRYSTGFLCIFFSLCYEAIVSWLLFDKIQLCFFKLCTGLPCPGCGLTHAGIALLRGDIVQSLRYHLLFIPIVICLCYCFYEKFVSPHKSILHNRFMLSLFVVDMGYFAFRMITSFPSGPYPMVYDQNSIAALLFRTAKNLLQ